MHTTQIGTYPDLIKLKRFNQIKMLSLKATSFVVLAILGGSELEIDITASVRT